MTGGRRLIREISRTQRRPSSVAGVLFISHQVCELMVPVLAGVIIDRAVATSDSGALLRWGGLLVATFVCLSWSFRWAERVVTRASQRSAHDLRLRMTRSVIRHEGLTDAPPVGQIVSIASSDVDATALIHSVYARGAAAIAAIATSAIVLLWISVPLGLVVVLGLPPVLGALQVLGTPIEKRVAAQQADVGRAAATAADQLHGLRVLKGLRAQDEATRRYKIASRSSLSAGLRAARLMAGHSGLTAGVTGLFVAVVALIGGRFAADGRISIGELIASVGVTQFLVGPLGTIGFAAAVRSAARASAERVAGVIDASPAILGGERPDPVTRGALAFRGVSHGQLHEIDLEVGDGTLLAVAASDPREASAIVALLARRADPDIGSITVGGVGLAELPLQQLRRLIVVADHDAVLFRGTVRDNIVLESNAGHRLHDVLHAVAADELDATLVDGLDTMVTERGMSLSGGQRQRVALARSFLRDAPVLVLHDATTAIDAVTEARIAAGLQKHRSGTTTIVLTASPVMLAAADEVIYIEDGRIADRAAHPELLGRNPRYAELVTT